MLDQRPQRVVARWIGGVSALLLACAGPPSAHERDWIEAESPNFQIISTMSPEETTALAIDLERFRVVISKFTNAPLGNPPIPTRIFAFGKTSDFKRFTRSPNVAGWMDPEMRENLIALTDYRGVDSGLVVRHEFVHFVLHNSTTIQYPTWYDEGFAEYLSALKVRKDRELVIGTADRSRIQVFKWAPWIPLRRVVAARGTDEFHDDTEVAVFYAEAWALVHYLQQGREGHHDVSAEMDLYLERVEAGSTDEDAFEEAFEIDFSRADTDLKNYLTHDIHSLVFDLAVLGFEPPEVKLRKMSRAEISDELGHLALALGDGKDAQVYFEAAIAADPSASRAQAGLGDALKFQNRWQEAEPHFQRAVELDPNDALNYLDLAEYFHEKAKQEAYAADRSQLLKAARRAYAKSQKLDPSLPETYAMYGSTYLEAGEDHAHALQTLEYANQLLPSNPDILLLLAKAYAQNERDLEARRLVARYVAWSHSGDRDTEISKILSEFSGDSSAHSNRGEPPN